MSYSMRFGQSSRLYSQHSTLKNAQAGAETRNFLWVIAFFLGYFVVFEPAPYDALLTLLALIGVGTVRQPVGALAARTSIALYAGLFLFLIANLASLSVAFNQFEAYRFFAITLYLVLTSLFLIPKIAQDGERISRAYFLGSALAALLTTFVVFAAFTFAPSIRPFVTIHGLFRVRGFFKDSNVLGPALVPLILYCIDRLFLQNRPNRVFWTISLAAASVLLLLTVSRGAYVALVTSLLVFLTLHVLTNRRAWGRLVYLPVGLITLALCAYAAFSIAEALGLADLLKQRTGLQSYDTQRFAVQNLLMREALKSPLGHGPGQTNVFLASYFQSFREAKAAHNTSVRVLFENGVLGLLGYLLVVVLTLLRGIKASVAPWKGQSMMILWTSVLCGIVVESFVIDTLHWRHFWLGIAVVWAFAARKKAAESLGRLRDVRATRQHRLN